MSSKPFIPSGSFVTKTRDFTSLGTGVYEMVTTFNDKRIGFLLIDPLAVNYPEIGIRGYDGPPIPYVGSAPYAFTLFYPNDEVVVKMEIGVYSPFPTLYNTIEWIMR